MKKIFLFLLIGQSGLLSATQSWLAVINETRQDFRLVLIRQDCERLVPIDSRGSNRLQLVDNIPCGTYQIILFRRPPGDKNSEPLAECFVHGFTMKIPAFGYSCIWDNVLLTEVGLVLKIQHIEREHWPLFDTASRAYVYLVPSTSRTELIRPRYGENTAVVARPKKYDVDPSRLNELFNSKIDDLQHFRFLLKKDGR